jgi:hypothetical protein
LTIAIDPKPLKATMRTTPRILDQIGAEKTKLGDGLARLDADLATVTAQLTDLETAERVLVRVSNMVERKGAVLTEGRIGAIAGRSAGEDDLFDERLSGAARLAMFPFRSVEMRWRAGRQQAAGRIRQLERIVVPMPSGSDIPRYA